MSKIPIDLLPRLVDNIYVFTPPVWGTVGNAFVLLHELSVCSTAW